MIALRNLLVATDFSEPAGVALEYGLELAKRFSAQLHVLHVVEDLAAHPYAALPMTQNLGELQKELERNARTRLEALLAGPERATLKPRREIRVSSSAAVSILDYAREREIDLIVVGTHGRRGLARVVLGSVASHVSTAAGCPVLTVRAHEREFISREDRPFMETAAARN